ncbi:unnamed protein product [Sympodiomycopsis kandeliae]
MSYAAQHPSVQQQQGYSNDSAHRQNSYGSQNAGASSSAGSAGVRASTATGSGDSSSSQYWTDNGSGSGSGPSRPQRQQSHNSAPDKSPAPLYSQSNTSAPAFDRSSAGYGGPPLADDVSRAFDQLNLAGGPGNERPPRQPPQVQESPSFGPQHIRPKSPGSVSVRSANTAGVGPYGSAAGSVERANAMYANQEMYQAAAEIGQENSLAAIADEVDAAASELRQGAVTPSPQQYGQSVNGSSHMSQDPNQPGPWQHDPQDWHASQQYQHHQQQHHQQQQHGYPGHDAQSWNQGYSHDGSGGYYPGMDPNMAPAGGYYDPNQYGYNGYYGDPSQQSQQQYYAQQGYGMDYSQGHPQQPPLSRNHSAGSHSLGMTPMAPGGNPAPSLYRQGTSLSMGSTGAGSNGTARRKSKDAGLPQQSLPYNKAFVNEYRARMKADPDPEEQFRFARYLIEAAKKIHDPKDGPKQARKYRDALLSESLKLIKRLATTGMGLGKPPYAEAQFFLANCFGNGSLGLQVDHEKAYNLYVQASKQNHPAATYRTAVCNEVGAGTRRDHHRAVLFYRKASALGDTAGMYKLGMILLNGLLGQPRNVREAIVWLKRAAGQADEDNPHALHELGLLHEKPNNIVPLDEAYARELFTQAAQLGYAPSQFKLGSAYEYGAMTCPVDPRRSIAWYTKAAGKNDGESELALSGWYLTGSEGVLKQSDAEAYLWARRAATKGIPKAEYAVGYYSEVGIGVKADIEEAKRWYMRAAAQGNKRAMQRLTELKKMGAKAGKARPTRKDAEKECVVM